MYFFKFTVLVITHFTKYFIYNKNFDIVIVVHVGGKYFNLRKKCFLAFKTFSLVDG